MGDTESEAMQALLATARRAGSPGAVLAFGGPTEGEAAVPLLSHRPVRDGRPTAYVCRRFACESPVTDPAELARLLA